MFAFQANFDRGNLAVVGKVEAGIVGLNNEEDSLTWKFDSKGFLCKVYVQSS